jgi:hypothetical protein
MTDEDFRARAPDLALQLATPDITDVFEERLPLAFNASLTLGCVAALVPAARSRPLSEGFDLTDIKVCEPLLLEICVCVCVCVCV